MSCACDDLRYRRWDPNTGLCQACGGRYAPARGGTPSADAPPDPTDVRMAISEAFLEYADLALARGDREAHGLWMQASHMARDFVVRRRFAI